MPKEPKSRNPYVSSTIPRTRQQDQWRRNTRVAPARSHAMHHHRRGLAVALIAVVLFAAVIIVGIIFLPRLFPNIGASNDQIRIELSDTRVLSDFRGLEVTPPDIDNYHYVETGNLIGPRFEEASVGEAEGTVAANDVKRTATADAIWHNRDVTVNESMAMTYTYDLEAETWKAGSAKELGLSVKPAVAPSAGAIAADLFTLLRAKDPSLATRFADATVRTDSALTIDGGTITATLSKREDNDVLTATVPINVTWSDSEGWVPTLGDVKVETTSVAPSVSDAPATTESQLNTDDEVTESEEDEDDEVPQL